MLKILTQPAMEPVTLAEIKSRLRLTDTTDDALITSQIPVAREFAEKILGRSLAQKTYAAFFERFPWTRHPITLSFPPLVSVSAIRYMDPSQNWQTWDSSEYVLGVNQEPGVIVEAANEIYPPTAIIRGFNTVEVDFVAGQYSGPGASTALEMVRILALYIYANPDASEESYPEKAVMTLRSLKLYGF